MKGSVLKLFKTDSFYKMALPLFPKPLKGLSALTAFEIEAENGIEVYNFEMSGYSPSTLNNCHAEVLSTITPVGNCYTIALASRIPKSSMPDDCSIAVNQSVSNAMQFIVEVL